MKHTIDATGQSIGRVATQAATILMGKNDPSFAPHVIPDVIVEITNAGKAKIPQVKMNKEYARYSGYPGGLIKEKRKHLIDRKGYAVVFEKAVYGMLPHNRLTKGRMKRLRVTE